MVDFSIVMLNYQRVHGVVWMRKYQSRASARMWLTQLRSWQAGLSPS